MRVANANGSIAIYVRRASGTAHGTLVCVHGGPNGDYRGNDDVFEQIGLYAPGLGYNVVQFDMFGAGASGGSQADITLESQLTDYRTAYEFAVSEYGVPIHVVAESMGATVAALDWSIPATSTVLLWPAFNLRDTDLEPYLGPEWRAQAERDGFIDDDGTVIGLAFLEELVAHDFASCFVLPKHPCLLVHGKADSAVPFQQSLDAVRAAGGEAMLFSHPTGDHGLQQESERAFTHGAIRWWLERGR